MAAPVVVAALVIESNTVEVGAGSGSDAGSEPRRRRRRACGRAAPANLSPHSSTLPTRMSGHPDAPVRNRPAPVLTGHRRLAFPTVYTAPHSATRPWSRLHDLVCLDRLHDLVSGERRRTGWPTVHAGSTRITASFRFTSAATITGAATATATTCVRRASGPTVMASADTGAATTTSTATSPATCARRAPGPTVKASADGAVRRPGSEGAGAWLGRQRASRASSAAPVRSCSWLLP